MPDRASFRHSPANRVFPTVAASAAATAFHWDQEPVVCAWRKLTHDNRTLGRTVPVPISCTPIVAPGVGVLIASDDGLIRLFDENLDKVFWERRIDASIYASPIIDLAQHNMIVCTTKGRIIDVDLRGRVKWHRDIEYPIYATPVILPGSRQMLVAAFHQRCFGINLADGEIRFSCRLPDPWHVAFGGSASYRDPYASPAVTSAGTYVLCSAEHVTCLNPDGAILWQRDLGHTIKASPALCHDTETIAAVLVSGDLVLLDAQTGDERARVFLAGKLIESPAISGSMLIAGNQFGTVFGIDLATARIQWSVDVGMPLDYTSFTLLPDGNFAFNSSRGNILALQREDGRFLWESSQVMGLVDHDIRLDITPVIAPNGIMYCASYSGFIYKFQFRPTRMEAT